MIESLSIAVHAFVGRVSMSFSVDETLLPRQVNLSTSFREVPSSVEMSPVWLQHIYSVLCALTWRPMPAAARSKLSSSVSAWLPDSKNDLSIDRQMYRSEFIYLLVLMVKLHSFAQFPVGDQFLKFSVFPYFVVYCVKKNEPFFIIATLFNETSMAQTHRGSDYFP